MSFDGFDINDSVNLFCVWPGVETFGSVLALQYCKPGVIPLSRYDTQTNY